MASHVDPEHYIPVRKVELVDLLCQEIADTEDQARFRQLARIVAATYHFEHQQLLEDLKDQYAPFDPDSVTMSLMPLTPEERKTREDNLFESFRRVMERANYTHLDHHAVIAATQAVSDWGVNMKVDFDVFERLEIFARGDTVVGRSRRCWWKLFRKETIQLPTYQRLVVILKLRPHKRLGRDVNTHSVFLKHFKDIPKVDLEMLLPGTRLEMSGLTRIKLGGSMVSGLGLILYNIFQQIVAGVVLAIGFFWGPLIALAGYGYKQWYGYQFTKQTYSLQLTESLYYQNLANNAGVLCQLLDEAEEQECREALLAYHYLWRHPRDSGWSPAELDPLLESNLKRRAGLTVNFEVEDALAKLEKLNLVTRVNDRYQACPVSEALARLDHAWDHFFVFPNKRA